MKRLAILVLLIPMLAEPAAGGDSQTLSDAIDVLLKGTDTAARIEAAKRLGQSGDARAVEPLLKMLGPGSRPVRWAAVEALGDLRRTDAVPGLLKYLERHEAYRWGKILTINALRACRDRRAVAPLTKVLAESKDPIVQRSAILALGELGNTQTVPVVMPYLTNEIAWLRKAAQDALDQMTKKGRHGPAPNGYEEWRNWYASNAIPLGPGK